MKAEEAEKEIGMALCWRCENRSIFLETGDGPRYECQQKTAVSGCYMFLPCKPVAVAPVAGEKRPIFGPWMIAGRIRAQGLVDDDRLRLKTIDVNGLAVAAVWEVKAKTKGTKKAK